MVGELKSVFLKNLWVILYFPMFHIVLFFLHRFIFMMGKTCHPYTILLVSRYAFKMIFSLNILISAFPNVLEFFLAIS